MNEQLLRTAHGLHQSGQHHEAERLYGEVLRRDPRNLSALLLLASSHFQRGSFTEALTRLDQLLAIKSDVFDAVAAHGAVLSGLGRHDEALASYEKQLAIRRTPHLY